jgi:sugar phosphate isomerase/epimerase
MNSLPLTRRRFFGGLFGLGLSASMELPVDAAEHNKELKLGVATYSLRKFSREQAIPMLQQLHVRYLSIKECHLPYKDSPEALARGRKEFDDAGFIVLSGGVVITFNEENSQLRKYFDYAKACRFPMLIMMPTAAQLPLLDTLAHEYNIRVAIHNHGPEDKNFPTPKSAYDAIRPFDHLIGLCIDVGHTARTGVNVVESIDRYFHRLYSVHMKDLKSLKSPAQCEVGRGVLPIPQILKLLQNRRYEGNVALEYEAEPYNPIPAMRASLAYMQGVLDGFAVKLPRMTR